MPAPMFAHAPAAPPPDVVAAWGLPASADIAPVPSAGFSGAQLHRVWVAGSRFMLKSFAPGTSPGRAAWIHQLVQHLSAAGIAEVPAVVPARGGATLVTDADGRMWELSHFVGGRPDHAPAPARAARAMETLATIHRAADRLPGERPRAAEPPAVARRRAQIAALARTPWTSRRSACRPSVRRDDEPMLDRWGTAIGIFAAHGAAAAIAAVSARPVVAGAVQPVLRDVWSEHVLFDDAGAVAGIVDLHAADIDTPATDLARLLGSWWRGGTADEAAAAALDAYARARPLLPAERRLVPWLDAAGVVCGLDNWFRWTLEERRRFADPQAVLGRVDRLLDRLPGALAAMHRG